MTAASGRAGRDQLRRARVHVAHVEVRHGSGGCGCRVEVDSPGSRARRCRRATIARARSEGPSSSPGRPAPKRGVAPPGADRDEFGACAAAPGQVNASTNDDTASTACSFQRRSPPARRLTASRWSGQGRRAVRRAPSATLRRPMRILILGGDGYLGWPTAMRFSARGHEVFVVDNFSRRRWHHEQSTDSLTPIRAARGADRRLARASPAARSRRSSATSRTASSSTASSPRCCPRRSSTTASSPRRRTR